MTERWRSVRGYEGAYEVSDFGRVRSLPREIVKHHPRKTYSIWHAGRMLRQSNHNQGYKSISLSRDGLSRKHLVHVLVAEAFIGPCPPEKEVCHDNGIKTDNVWGNLRYDTHESNIGDMYRHGTQRLGEELSSSKLTEEKVRGIRRDKHLTLEQLAEKYGTSWGNVGYVRRGKTWRHVV